MIQRFWLVRGAILLPIVPIAVAAQISTRGTTIPAVTYPVVAPATHPLTATDAVVDVDALARYGRPRWFSRAIVASEDSVRSVVVTRAAQWLVDMQSRAIAPLSLDDAGRLALLTAQDRLAQQYIAQRLHVPHLSADDQAVTLLLAVQSFADSARPDRLPIAEHYLAQLERLPLAASGTAIVRAHVALLDAYEACGRTTEAFEHGFHALAVIPRLPYVDRGILFAVPAVYVTVSTQAADNAETRLRLDRLRLALRQALIPSVNVIADDSAMGRVGRSWMDQWQKLEHMTALVGARAPAIRATVVFHPQDDPSSGPAVATRASIAPPLDDGVVRIVLFGPSLAERDGEAVVIALQHVQQMAPAGVHVMYVTSTVGYWPGDGLLSPDDEVARLRTAYLDTLHIRFPIALWAGTKFRTATGGWLPTPSPNRDAFHFPDVGGGTYALIIDRRGIIRHIITHSTVGGTPNFGPQDQARALHVATDLLRQP